MKKFMKVAFGAAVVVASMLSGAAAQAEERYHPDIEHALSHQPGGVVVDESTVVWPQLGMTLDVRDSADFSVQTVGQCATGRVCAFRYANLTGSMLSWSTCGTHSTSALPGVGSIANARSSGTLQARNGTTVVASAGPQASTNVFSVVTNVRC